MHWLTVKELSIPSSTDVLKALELDFIERTYVDKYVSQKDVHFIQFLSNHITQKGDGHYEIPLPFKGNSPPILPNSKRLVTVCLQCLKKKLKANKQYYDQIKTFMEETMRVMQNLLLQHLRERRSATFCITEQTQMELRTN